MRPRLMTLRFPVLFLVAVMLITGIAPVMAQESRTNSFTATPLTLESQFHDDAAKADGMVSVLIKLGDAPLATYDGSIPGLPATSPRVTGQPLDVESAASQAYLTYLNGKIDEFVNVLQEAIPLAEVTHRYDVVLGGVAARVPGGQLDLVRQLGNVLDIYQDQLLKIDTYRSPTFISAPTTWNKLGGQSSAGEGVIVGVLDSGIWPENPAFADPDPSGKPYAAPPGGPYACEFSGGTNPGPAFTCNNKLIGAYRFMDTYETVVGLESYEYSSARDDDGHGTHTASTAAGNGKVSVNLLGNNLGQISGIAPRAHVIAYKVCGELGCYQTDSAAAIQQAIADGVDVLNFSISGGQNPYSDIVAQAFFDAYEAGIFVAVSGGNSGPGANTVNHRAPWVTTVAASTIDRSFLSTVTLVGASGTLNLTGATITTGISTPARVVVNTSDTLCLNPAPAGSFTGQIVVCRRGTNARNAKSANVAAGGAVGMLLYNPTPQGINTDLHPIPTVHLESTEGTALLNFLSANPGGVTATFPPGAPGSIQGDVIAGFSSRGGTGQTLGVSKPDITAPGVNILAGYTGSEYGVSTPIFNFLSGTSMSSPHIAGAAALLKDLYPDWTPGQIKSALMTTARTTNLFKEDGVTPFTPFDAGSGRVDLGKAWDPGLTFDVAAEDYVTYQNELWKANYPSLYIPRMLGKATVQRTAKEVSGYDTTWRLSVRYPTGQPTDFNVGVPASFWIPANGEHTFDITIDGRDVPIGQVRHATIVMTSDHCVLRFPVTFIRQQPSISLNTSCSPGTFPRGGTSNCTIQITNSTFDDATIDLVDNLPSQIELVEGSVSGATMEGWRRLSYSGVLPGRRLPTFAMTNVSGGSPAGYLPLANFGITPVSGVGDDTITNFTVPQFIYAGRTYDTVGFASNGFATAGRGTSAPFTNQRFPSTTTPNNVLAPFWTDLDPRTFGGALRIAILTDTGTGERWIVLDWANVARYNRPSERNNFQIWIGLNGVEDVSYVYGTTSAPTSLTVGAENDEGTAGVNYFYNGTGTRPTPTSELILATTPGQTYSHTVRFQVKGMNVGTWTNYAELQSNRFFGTSIVGFRGEVTR